MEGPPMAGKYSILIHYTIIDALAIRTAPDLLRITLTDREVSP
jgi:hypothetical protein